MISFKRPAAIRCCLLLGCLAAITACLTDCSEPVRPTLIGDTPAPLAITPLITVSDSGGSTARVTIGLDFHGSLTRVGSVTGRLVFDSTALHFVRVEDAADGVLRAVNPVSGEVRVAAAAINGLDPTRLFVLLFSVRDPSALGRMHLDINELHSDGSVDFKALVESTVRSGRP